uniref:Uncharacterized protein n=1 Tax=Sus scrofa TaxID=9823 RepID=A0A8W4FQ25_PIG
MNFLFFFNNGPSAGFIHLEMVASAAAGLNLRYTSINSTFSCAVMTFFCFLRALSALLVALSMGPAVLFMVYDTVLNTRNTGEL